MLRPLLLCILLLGILDANGYDKRKKRYYSNVDQTNIIYTGKKTAQPEATPQNTPLAYYIGFTTRYAQGTQSETTRLSSDLYRIKEEEIIYTELTFTFGIGDIGEDRLEFGLSMNKNFVPKDSAADTEFEKGRSLGVAYSFVFDSLYNRVDSSNVIPYFQIGLAVGEFDIKDEYKEYYASQSILSTDYLGGMGLYSQLASNLELHLGYEVIKRDFQDIKESMFTKKTAHLTQGISAGLNYHF